jgi:serine/threonine protein kinase/Tfp pilus assembly protein PilF
MIGKTISHYRITEELGRGGMGVVYKAEDSKLHRTVALKFLPQELTSDPESKERFVREARAAAALNHPNIATIHEINEADGHTFIAMEYVEGESLREKVRSGVMSVEEALTLATHVARGLSKAHGKGIVHRDIKPGNILLTPDGEAKIVDFGLAKLGAQSKLTRTGTTLGTAAYMSPEQVRGEEVDHRSDLWSLSVMLYEMLTGTLPFKGDYEPALMYSIMNESPEPVTSMRSDVPVAIEDILEKALSKDPAKRYQTMEELLSELETQRDHMTLGIKETQFRIVRKMRRRKKLVAGAVAAAAAIAIAAILFRLLYEPSMGIDSLAVLPFTNLSGDPEQEYFSDGMTESLINEVGQIGALRVVSRTSVMQFKKTDKSPQEIARALDVDAIVEASVSRVGERIKITAQLVRVETGEIIWSEDYNRETRDFVIVLSEVTRAIAGKIRVALTPQEEERLTRVRTVDPEAQNLYLKGRHYMYKWTKEDYLRAIQLFRQAIDIDPTFAEAYIGMANCYIGSGIMAYMSPQESMPKAKAAVDKVLELDDSMGEAYTIRGWIKYSYDWDESGPDEDFRRGINLSPNSPAAHEWYAQYLGMTGRKEEAIAYAERAAELDPLAVTMQEAVVRSYVWAGMLDEAEARIEEVQKTAPEFGLTWLPVIYARRGLVKETLEIMNRVEGEIERNQVIIGNGGAMYAAFGRLDKAREAIAELMTLSEEQWVDPYYVAKLYAALGEWDNALDWLERCYEERSPSMLWTRNMDFPDEKGYRERYQAILAKAFPSSE